MQFAGTAKISDVSPRPAAAETAHGWLVDLLRNEKSDSCRDRGRAWSGREVAKKAAAVKLGAVTNSNLVA